MRLSFLVEVELDGSEFGLLNAKRLNMGQQAHNAQGFVENKIIEALTVDKLLSGATVAVAEKQ